MILPLFLAFAVQVFALPPAPPPTLAGCVPKAMNISNPDVPFLDYKAFSKASEAAIGYINGLSASGDLGSKPAKVPKALKCDRIRVRKEWRKLTRAEKKAYIKAEKCLIEYPSFGLAARNGGFEGVEYNVRDDFTSAHAKGFGRYHAGPKFLPFHRWHMWLHGYALEKLCHYRGPVPYWDYTLDAGPNVYKAPVFDTDPEIGFGDGGSVAINELGGSAGGYIVDNGAFANYRPNLPKPHYLVRNFTADDLYNPGEKYGVGLSDTYNKTARDRVLGAKDFWSFEIMIDGLDEPSFRSVHNSIHFLLGGDGQSFKWLDGTPWNGVAVFGSNEPLFYLHHRNVDHVWWEWQNKQPEYQFSFGGRPGGNDTICDAVPLNDFGPDIPIGLALKTEWYPQCYTYEY